VFRVAAKEPTMGDVLLACDFKNASASGFSIDENMDTEVRETDGVVELLVRMHGAPAAGGEAPFIPVWTSSAFDDLDVSVTGRIVEDQSANLANFAIELRSTRAVSCYRAAASDRTYALILWQGDKSTTLVDWPTHPALRKGEPNRLRVVARGPQIRIYLNGVLATSIHDTTLTSGRVLLVVGPNDGAYTIAFSDFQIRDVPPR
jgi:hypothetical protein